jgi:hypothetical protein
MQQGTSLPCRKGEMVGPLENSENCENHFVGTFLAGIIRLNSEQGALVTSG